MFVYSDSFIRRENIRFNYYIDKVDMNSHDFHFNQRAVIKIMKIKDN